MTIMTFEMFCLLVVDQNFFVLEFTVTIPKGKKKVDESMDALGGSEFGTSTMGEPAASSSSP